MHIFSSSVVLIGEAFILVLNCTLFLNLPNKMVVFLVLVADDNFTGVGKHTDISLRNPNLVTVIALVPAKHVFSLGFLF